MARELAIGIGTHYVAALVSCHAHACCGLDLRARLYCVCVQCCEHADAPTVRANVSASDADAFVAHRWLDVLLPNALRALRCVRRDM
jgi:hypothetical protein